MKLERADGGSGAQYAYDAWGNIISMTGPLAELNPLRYRGYVYDQETGFYYLNSRYYDPAVGRFISVDDEISGIGGEPIGYNLFAYSFNYPVNLKDSTGSWPSLSQVLGAVAITSAAVAAVALVVAVPALAVAGVGAISAGSALGVAGIALATSCAATVAAAVAKVVEETKNQSHIGIKASILCEIRKIKLSMSEERITLHDGKQNMRKILQKHI